MCEIRGEVIRHLGERRSRDWIGRPAALHQSDECGVLLGHGVGDPWTASSLQSMVELLKKSSRTVPGDDDQHEQK